MKQENGSFKLYQTKRKKIILRQYFGYPEDEKHLKNHCVAFLVRKLNKLEKNLTRIYTYVRGIA